MKDMIIGFENQAINAGALVCGAAELLRLERQQHSGRCAEAHADVWGTYALHLRRLVDEATKLANAIDVSRGLGRE